jgi:hypothetical protein
MAARIQELVKEYDIKFDPERPVSSDGAMADRVFQAGVQLFHEIGVYHMDTSRVIKYGMDEIEEGLRLGGKPCQESYDMLTVEPTQEWSDIYHRVRDELFDLGLEFTGKRENWPQRTAPTSE